MPPTVADVVNSMSAAVKTAWNELEKLIQAKIAERANR